MFQCKESSDPSRELLLSPNPNSCRKSISPSSSWGSSLQHTKELMKFIDYELDDSGVGGGATDTDGRCND